jgi:hypothetical protein
MPLRNILASPVSTRRNTAAFIAFVVAPILPAVAFAIISPGLLASFDLISVAMLSLVFYVYACAFIAALALPLYLLASKFHAVKLWTALLAGTLGGGAVALVVPAGMSQPYYVAAVRGALPLYAPLGAATGALFFLVLVGANRLLRVNSPTATGGL